MIYSIACRDQSAKLLIIGHSHHLLLNLSEILASTVDMLTRDQCKHVGFFLALRKMIESD